MSRKKIFRLFSRLNVGGPSIHVVNLAVGLEAHGYDTTLIVGAPDISEGSMEAYAREAGARVVRMSSFQAAISPIKDAATLLRLIILFLRERPDIVHTHTFKAGVLGRLAAFVTRVPIVVHTYHGHLLSGYSAQWKVRLLVFVENLLAKISGRLIAVSSTVADDLIRAGVAPQTQFKIVELGFDMNRIVSEVQQSAQLKHDLGLTQTARLVGIVGRLVPIKDVDLFLKALTPLLVEFSNVHLVVIGDGKERARLEHLAQQLTEHRERVHFTGWRQPVTRDLRDLDVCVCSSKNEGTSVSIIEAVVAKVPVVSTHVGGMGDLLASGQWGRLVPRDAQALLQAVRDVLTSNPDQVKLNSASLEFQRRFSSARLLLDTERVYSELDEQRSRDHSLSFRETHVES